MDMTLWWIYLASRADVVWPLIVFRGDCPLVEDEVGLIGRIPEKTIAFWEVILVVILSPRRRAPLKIDSCVYDAVIAATHRTRHRGVSSPARWGESRDTSHSKLPGSIQPIVLHWR